MLYNQPLATRFGSNLVAHIVSGTWTKLDIAVAWVRESGLKHLAMPLRNFLAAGNELTVIVGIDFDNTTYEGLEALLDLEKYGAASTFVHHNEAGTIFHPKLYLFRNDTRGNLIVGSNNITEAGLFRNTEAGLELSGAVTDLTISSADDALLSWRDLSLGLAKRLDASFLSSLLTNGYIAREAATKRVSKSRRTGARTSSILFGSVPVTPPPMPPGYTSTVKLSKRAKGASTAKKKSTVKTIPAAPTAGPGLVLLMRVRKARGTQIQIPIRVMNTAFFRGVTDVKSVASGVSRGIHPTHATRSGPGANPNTLKLEMPETASMSDPVVRFERNTQGVNYEVYDRSSVKGKIIMRELENGRRASPPLTELTVPRSPQRSTWWRFI
jgi:hypothetical protein